MLCFFYFSEGKQADYISWQPSFIFHLQLESLLLNCRTYFSRTFIKIQLPKYLKLLAIKNFIYSHQEREAQRMQTLYPSELQQSGTEIFSKSSWFCLESTISSLFLVRNISDFQRGNVAFVLESHSLVRMFSERK